MKFLSSVTVGLLVHVQRLIPSLHEVIAYPIMCNQNDLSPTYFCYCKYFSVIFVLRYLISLGTGTVIYMVLRGPTPGLYFLFDCN